MPLASPLTGSWQDGHVCGSWRYQSDRLNPGSSKQTGPPEGDPLSLN